MAEPGLRERKKQQTRQRIVAAAIGLFADRGFDHVPVAEVARAAEVSEATVFNYFPSKEDLVYEGMDEFEDRLLTAVRERAAGTPVLAAFRDVLLQPAGSLANGDPTATARIATVARIIADSPTLQARELRSYNRHTTALAEAIGNGTTTAWVVANALMGVNRAMKDAVHRGALAGRDGAQITRDVVAQARAAFELLELGLGGYGGT
ncbi:TetR/AcrR family transcriptional regulator [Kibdelosporangium lantanae]|uniref:TetR/AcrR family transcriptional regulator n=1 Tax=Kibdelosporangium lantanae TaxID=1497396 RepID=A0ABW3M438_9PSEU